MMISLLINDRPIAVKEGTTIWDAARQLGIDIPVLCHQPRLRPVGVCRMCVVDVGGRVLAASCVRACEPGMAVQTSNARVEKSRRVLLQLLLADHPSPCARERTTGDCELEAMARSHGLSGSPFAAQPPTELRDVSSPVIAVDHDACILCDRCIRACDEVQSNHVIGRAW